MRCDMCGKESQLFHAKIEGTMLSVCKECSQYGESVRLIRTKTRTINKPRPKKVEKVEVVVPKYATLIKKKREKKGLKQKEFAQMVGERESLLQKIESGSFVPSIQLARKLEKALKITLVEEQKDEQVDVKRTHAEALTMGDFIKVKE